MLSTDNTSAGESFRKRVDVDLGGSFVVPDVADEAVVAAGRKGVDASSAALSVIEVFDVSVVKTCCDVFTIASINDSYVRLVTIDVVSTTFDFERIVLIPEILNFGSVDEPSAVVEYTADEEAVAAASYMPVINDDVSLAEPSVTFAGDAGRTDGVFSSTVVLFEEVD